MNPLPSLPLPEDPKEAQKVFQSLPLENQLELILQSRGKERLHTLFLSEHPEQLIQRLPELEVFLTVKEVGERDSLDLISLTTPEQFQYLLDLDFWKRDQLDPEKVLHWMEILLESGENKVTQFIQYTDPELIALLLKKFLRVTTLDGEHLEGLDRIPLFTLDQFYFVDFKGKKTRELLEPFLRILYRIDIEGYRRLMESVICEIESELEETGYRLRNGRLNDYGFPDLEEALEIYRFVNPDSLVSGERILEVNRETKEKKGSSIFYLSHQNEGPFLSSILSQMDDPHEQDRWRQEIILLCNKAIVAEAVDLSNMVGVERAIKKVYHTLNLGLQYLSKEDEIKALEILRSFPLQKLFQCGVSTTIVLKRRAESILKGSWFSGDRENLVFLDSPYVEKFEGILKRRPNLYREGVYEDFKTLQDLEEAENFLKFIEAIVHFFGEEWKVYPRDLKKMDWSRCHPERWEEITLSTIFLTSLSNHILRGMFQFEAIPRAQLSELLSRLFERDTQGKGVVRMEIKNKLREWFNSVEKDKKRQDHLRAFFDFCLDLLEQEYGKMSPGEEVDPRFVKGLLIRS